jgi:hypothetical protein
MLLTPLCLRRLEEAELDRVIEIMKNGTDITRADEATRALAEFTGNSQNT